MCSFIKLSFPNFTHIPLNYKAINHSYGTSFRRLKRTMVATVTDDPARSVPASFLTAIAAKVNALWRAFYGRTSVAPLGTDSTKHADEMHVYPVVRDDGVEKGRSDSVE